MKLLKRVLKHKTKTGASLLVVLVTVSILIVMGTSFGFIALNAYNNSEKRLCEQQAFFTAEASLQILSRAISEDRKYIMGIDSELQHLLKERLKTNGTAKPTEEDIFAVSYNIVNLDENALTPANPLEAKIIGLMGGVRIDASYASLDKQFIKLTSTASYKGYQYSLSAKIVKTNKGALEISKIFSNSQCWNTPIITLVANTTDGDVYISSPGNYVRDKNDELLNNDDIYIDPKTGKPVVKPAGSNYTNKEWNDHINSIYSNISLGDINSTASANLVAHTKPFNIDNKPVRVAGDGKNRKFFERGDKPNYYNDWTEIYIYSGVDNIEKPAVVNGDMYVNSKALIGLYDKGQRHKMFWKYLDVDKVSQSVRKKYVAYNNYVDLGILGEQGYVFKNPDGDNFNNGYDDKYIEHGGNGQNNKVDYDIFYDYYSYPPDYDVSRLTHNGNIYLFDDARIECYDSTKTSNALQGIKNNIYAHKNLVIDGFACTIGEKVAWDSIFTDIKAIPWAKNVQIYGDVMCEGDLTISGATIYGDVYCNGNHLTITDSDIFGSIYFSGSDCKMDYANIWGDEKVYKKDGKDVHYSYGFMMPRDENGKEQGMRYIPLNGGNIYIAGEHYIDDKGVRQPSVEPADINQNLARQIPAPNDSYDVEPKFGFIATNTKIKGTIYSNVNTKIRTAYWNGGESMSYDGKLVKSCDRFGNIIVDAFLKIDGSELYDPSGDTYKDNATAFVNNKVVVDGVVMARRLHVKQANMSEYGNKDKIKGVKGWPHNESDYGVMFTFNKVLVGKNGYNIVGTDRYHWCDGSAPTWIYNDYTNERHRSIKIVEFYSNATVGTFKDVSGGLQSAKNNSLRDEHYSNRTFYSTKGAWSTVPVMDNEKQSIVTEINSNAVVVKMVEVIKNVIKNDKAISPNNMPGISWTPKEKPTLSATEIGDNVGNLIKAFGKYLTEVKYPNRVNAYYAYAYKKVGYKKYDAIEDITKWADSDSNEGMYHRYDEDNPTGVWRTINILRWSAPALDMTDDNDKAKVFKRKEDDKKTGNVTIDELVNYNFATFAPNDKNTIIIKKDVNILQGMDMRLIVGTQVDKETVTPQRIIFDSSDGNLHCAFEGGITLLKGSEILIRGGNGVFLYLGENPPNGDNDQSYFDSVAHNNGSVTGLHEVLHMDPGSRIGEVMSSTGDVIKRDSLYLITNESGSFNISVEATMEAHIYAPHGKMYINPMTTLNSDNKVVYIKYDNVILKGSMLIEGFIADAKQSNGNIITMYQGLTYKYIPSPIIMDGNIQYGDTLGQIGDYSQIDWGFVGFE